MSKKRLINCKNILFKGFAFFLLILSACNTGVQKKTNEQKVALQPAQNFLAGKIYPRVKELNKTSFSYALYLPKGYTPDKTYPVIFFFDAHARGWLPIKKYHQLADSMKYILAASNDSQNGQSTAKRNKIIYAFMADVEQRFHVDNQRIYTAGFSGGARIAAGIGLFNKNIAGVIGCAAGNPQTLKTGRTDLTMVEIVGNKDFNYLEMLLLEQKLESAHQPHQLLIFDGKHDWPPKKVMQQAFLFLETDAMRRKLITSNDSLIKQLQTRLNNKRKAINPAKQPLARFESDKKLVAFLHELTPVESYRKEMEHLSRLPLFQHQKTNRQRLLQNEQKSQQTLASALGAKDVTWWKKEIAQLYNNKKPAKNSETKLMNVRLLNYLSLMSYLYADANLRQGNPQGAAKFLMIYKKVDPTNPEVYFLRAKQRAMLGASSKEILNLLNKSVQLGFNAPMRIKHFAKAAALPDSSDFQKILNLAYKNLHKLQAF